MVVEFVACSRQLQDTCFGAVRRELEHSADDILPVSLATLRFMPNQTLTTFELCL